MKAVNFLDGHLFINGVELTNYAEGDDVMKWERLAESVMYKVGAGGHMIISLNPNKSAKLTVKLLASSPSNSYLGGLLNLEEGGSPTFTPIQASYQDVHRNDVVTGIPGCIVKWPEFNRGADNTGNDMEWAFVFERGFFVLGNPALTGIPSAVAEAL